MFNNSTKQQKIKNLLNHENEFYDHNDFGSRICYYSTAQGSATGWVQGLKA